MCLVNNLRRYLFVAIVVLSISMVVSCEEPEWYTQDPPPAFFEGTPEDSAAIVGILTNNYPELLITSEFFNDILDSVGLPAIEIYGSEMFFDVDSPLIKQHVDSCGLSLVNTPLEHVWDLWFSKETTGTVYLLDTFDFSLSLHADQKIVAHYDSAVVIGSDTSWMIGTIDTFNVPYYAERLGLVGDGRRLILFDVVRDWIEDPEHPGDTVYAVLDPRQWFLSKLSYGRYCFPTVSSDIPGIDRIVFARQNGLNDTILSSCYDTLYSGHVMNRFRAIDSLLEYTSGDSIMVTIILSGPLDESDCSFFMTIGDGARMNIAPAGSEVELAGDGITNIYVEVVANDFYYYVNPEKSYKATLWLIPVIVNTQGNSRARPGN